MLIRRNPSRSTIVPPKMPDTTTGTIAAAAVIPVRDALPVLWSTNHGIATSAATLPDIEIAFAAKSDTSGPRRRVVTTREA
jgi:hypothetical protein